jgi:hypothetical protein
VRAFWREFAIGGGARSNQAVLALLSFPKIGKMLSSRQPVKFALTAMFVVGWLRLAIVDFSDGAWVRGILGICLAAGMGLVYTLSLARSQRA